MVTVGTKLSVLPTMPPAPGHGSREDGGLADLSSTEGSGNVTRAGTGDRRSTPSVRALGTSKTWTGRARVVAGRGATGAAVTLVGQTLAPSHAPGLHLLPPAHKAHVPAPPTCEVSSARQRPEARSPVPSSEMPPRNARGSRSEMVPRRQEGADLPRTAPQVPPVSGTCSRDLPEPLVTTPSTRLGRQQAGGAATAAHVDSTGHGASPASWWCSSEVGEGALVVGGGEPGDQHVRTLDHGLTVAS